jgi:hypothetical protein
MIGPYLNKMQQKALRRRNGQTPPKKAYLCPVCDVLIYGPRALFIHVWKEHTVDGLTGEPTRCWCGQGGMIYGWKRLFHHINGNYSPPNDLAVEKLLLHYHCHLHGVGK